MAESASYEPESNLPPPGDRWGNGAHSVLPYLTKSLQARPVAAAEVREQRGAASGEPQPLGSPPPRG